MKTIILLVFTTLFACHTIDSTNKEQKSCYYFCVSRTINEEASVSKNFILYTEINSMLEDVSLIRSKAADWQKFVDKNCNSLNICTSDLNYYPTLEQAQLRLKQTIERFENTSKFQLKKVEF